jgi:hypothetical protein
MKIAHVLLCLISLSLPSCVDMGTLGPIIGGGGYGGGGYGGGGYGGGGYGGGGYGGGGYGGGRYGGGGYGGGGYGGGGYGGGGYGGGGYGGGGYGGGGYGGGGYGGGGLEQARPILEEVLPGSGNLFDVVVTVVKISEALNSNSGQRTYARQQYAGSGIAQRKVQPGEPRYVGVKTRDPSSGKKGVIIVSRKTGEVVDNKLYIPEAPVRSGSVTRVTDKDCVIM